MSDDRWLTAEEHEELRTLANGFAPQEDGINESRMAWLSVRALYEIAALEDEVASLQSENASLQAKVERLERRLAIALQDLANGPQCELLAKRVAFHIDEGEGQ